MTLFLPNIPTSYSKNGIYVPSNANPAFKLLKRIIVCLLLLVVVGNVSGATKTWDGGAGTNIWTDPNNWSENTIPIANDDILFNTGTTLIISNVQTITIAKLRITSNSNITLRPPINNSRTITVNSATSDAIVVESGSTLTITGKDATNDQTLTLTTTNTSGLVANISGTLTVGIDNNQAAAGGAFAKGGANAVINFNSGSIYKHAILLGTIPTATWDVSSTCLITGATAAAPGGISQTFGNFTWNCSGQSAYYALSPTDMYINGNLEVDNSGTFDFAIEHDITIGKNLIINGGSYRICYQSDRILTVNGDVINNGGELLINSSMTTNANGTLKVLGNFNFNDGTINARATTAGSSASNIIFCGDGKMQSYTSGGTITSSANNNIINFTVNSGAYLQMGTGAIPSTLVAQTIGGTNTFTVANGGTLGITSAAGITTTGATGNIQANGTNKRSYNVGANYTYNGAGAQVTGNGLTGANNLTINNSAGVTLSNATIVSGTTTLSSGILTTNGTNLLTINNPLNTALSGGSISSFINGPVKWTLPTSLAVGSTFNFAVGKGNTYLPFSLVNPTTGTGTVTAQVEAFAADAGGGLGTLTSKSGTEYWSLGTSGNFTNSSVSLTRQTTITPLNAIAGSGTINGTYSDLAGTPNTYGVLGSNAIGTTNRFFLLANNTPTITPGTFNGSPYCSGTAISIPFTVTGTYKTGNNFTAQLSNASGSFSSPVSIGSLASAGTISGTIPVGTVYGTGYRIRVVSSNPVINGTDNGSNLTVYPIPLAPTPNGALICIGSIATLSASGAVSGEKYRWYDASTGGNLLKTSTDNADNVYLTPVLPSTTNYWVSILNAGLCESSRTLVTATYPSASTDDQNAFGIDSWVGHVYDDTNKAVAYNGNFFNYFGHYPESESIDQNFGGSTTCFNIYSNSIIRSIYTETFSVRYRMNSTKKGLYLVDLGSDDGSRLTVDGTPLHDNWGDQGFTSRPRVLMSLKGNSSLVYDFYENGGDNRVAFQNLTQIFANTITNTSQNICVGNSGSVISGDIFGTLPAGISLSGTGYQWMYSTTPLGTRIIISGATGATFIPNSSILPFNAPGTYYIYRNAILSSINNVIPNPYVSTNESNAATITITAIPTATISYAGTPFCKSVSTAQPATLTGSGAFTGGTYSSTAGLSINTGTGVIIPSTSTAGTYTVKYTIPASGGCLAVPVTTIVTITAIPTATISYEGTTFCKSVSTAQSATIAGTGAYTGGTFSSTVGLSINAGTGAIIPSLSTSGTYSVTYTIPSSGGCAAVPTSVSVTITAAVTINAFSPVTSTRCQGANVVTTTTTATNSTGITYSLDATTKAFTGNSIVAATGAVTYSSSWSGATIITASAAGCDGPVSTTLNVTTTPTVTINAFLPSTSTRCQGAGTITTTTTATNSTGITYSLDATSAAFAGNSIDAVTGAATYAAGWSGTTVITASAAGCNGPALTTHIVTVYSQIGNNTYDFSSNIYGTICATAAENANAILTAPNGNVFINVGFASYGMPTGNCNSYSIGSCNSLTSQSKTEGLVLGKNTANIPATNDLFGDPCSGTLKHFNVQAYYTLPICSGNAPGTIIGILPTGGNGLYTYLWESSITGSTGSFTACLGVNTSKDYTPGSLLQTTCYRRTVTSGGCNNISTVIQITVLTICPPNLGSSSAFAVFTGNGAITISGATVIKRNLGTNLGAVTGLEFATITGTTHIADTYTLQATTDLNIANEYLNTLGGKVLATLDGGQVLTPGVYFTSAITITGELTLDALGDPNALFIIRTNGAFSTGASTTIKLIGKANMSNVYWQINGAFALATNSTFIGNTIVTGAVSIAANSIVLGNVLTISGAVTIVGGTVSNDGLENKYILIENNFISSAQSIRNNTIPNTLTGTLPMGGTVFNYSWERSITNATNGFISITTNGNNQDYSPGALTQSTWYRRKVSIGKYYNISEAIKITVLAVTPPVTPPNFGTASSFSLFTINGDISNTGNSILTGNIGTDKGTISGFPPGTIIGGSLHSNDAITSQATADLIIANTYMNTLNGEVLGVTIVDGKTIIPGVYFAGAATTINGEFILDAQGDPNAVFIIIIGGALTVGHDVTSQIKLINSADLNNVYWQVRGGAFSLESSSVFKGTIIVDGAISLLSNSSILGNALSVGVGGAIKIYNNNVSNDNLINRFTSKGNWSDPTKWSKNILSAPSENIIISAAATVDGDFTNNDLTIDLNGSVTVLPGKSLTVSGNLTNTAGASGLIIKADADQLKANGSLIFNNPQTIPVNATVEMFSKASWDLNQSAGSKYKWQFFGIPFKSLKASPAFDGAYVRRLNEKGDSIGHWLQLSNDSVLTKFTGYEITQPGAKTYTFSGELVNKDTTINLPYTSGAYRPGQYLFCNPYTAAIDLTIPSKILFGENTEESVYLYNTGTLKDWETTNGATVVGTAPGQYSVSPAKVAGDAGIPGQIPSMQGFLIKATGPIGSTGQITIPYSSLVKNNELQRAPSKNKSGSSDKVYTKIDIQGSRFADRMWIFSDSSCTPFFDNGWDGYKLKGSFLTPQLYSMGIDGDYQVNAVADMNNTQLGFQAGEDSEYTLTFTNENLLTLYSAVFLVDFVANKTIDITTSGTTYSFVSEPTPTTVKRFKIFTLQNKKDAPDINTQINVFNSGNTVFVQNLSNLNGEMRVYDMMGRTIKSTTFGPFGVTSVQLGNITGAYIVQATTDFNKVSEKIIIAKE